MVGVEETFEYGYLVGVALKGTLDCSMVRWGKMFLENDEVVCFVVIVVVFFFG